MDNSDIGADCAEKKRLIDNCRSEIIALAREECLHSDEICMEYKESYSSNEVSAASPLIQEIESSLQDYFESSSPFIKHERKRKLISLLKETITLIEEINSEYSKIFVQMEGSKLMQRMTLDRSLVNIGTVDEKSRKTNHKELEVGAYFSSFSKICDLNVEYDTTSNILNSTEELSSIVSKKYAETCNCLNTMIDKKKSLEETLAEMENKNKSAQRKTARVYPENEKERKISKLARIGQNTVEKIRSLSTDDPLAGNLSKIMKSLVNGNYRAEEEVIKDVDDLLESLTSKKSNKSEINGINSSIDSMISRIKKLTSQDA